MSKEKEKTKVKVEKKHFTKLSDLMDNINSDKDTKDAIQPLCATTIKCDAISTGSLAVDAATGIWGFPRGRITEVFGPESSGKTTLTIMGMVQCQKMGLIPAFIDVEHAFDPKWATNLGLKMGKDDLVFSQPDSAEQALLLVERLAESGLVNMIVVDSVAGLVPQAELEGEITDNHMALLARLMSKSLRKLASIVHNNKCCVIFINQLRDKPGVMYGPTETTPGGRALKYFASMRIDIKRQKANLIAEMPIGNSVKVKIIKNKLAAPFSECEFSIFYGTDKYPIYGADYSNELINIGLEHGVIKKNSSHYSFGDYKLGNGEMNASKTLADNPELSILVLNAIKDKNKSISQPNTVNMSDEEPHDDMEPAEIDDGVEVTN